MAFSMDFAFEGVICVIALSKASVALCLPFSLDVLDFVGVFAASACRAVAGAVFRGVVRVAGAEEVDSSMSLSILDFWRDDVDRASTAADTLALLRADVRVGVDGLSSKGMAAFEGCFPFADLEGVTGSSTSS